MPHSDVLGSATKKAAFRLSGVRKQNKTMLRAFIIVVDQYSPDRFLGNFVFYHVQRNILALQDLAADP
jgi:hypothetical protein